MATKEQITNILKEADGKPVSRATISEKLGEPLSNFQTQLDRWVKQGLIEDTGEHNYVFTDVGKKEALDEEAIKLIGDEKELLSDESLGATEYQQFIRLGKITGVLPINLIIQTGTHVWNGGDYTDLDWVAEAFKEMGIRRDLATRWWHSWRSFLRQPIPSTAPEFVTQPASVAKEGGSKTGEKKETKGKRDYIMNEDDNPTYVGESLGDLDHDEAFELARIRAGAKARQTVQTKSDSPGDSLASKAVDKIISDMDQPPGPPVDETTRLLNQVKALKEVLGLGDKPDSAGELANLITLIKSVQEITGDNKPAMNPNAMRQLLVDKQTGEVKEIAPGQPLIIIRESAPVSQFTPIQMTDRDGNPMVLDLSTFIKLEEHKDKQRRDEDSHETKMQIAKGFKDLLNKAGTALTHMAEEAKE